MKKEEMVVGREYLHCEAIFNKRYVFVGHDITGRGTFSEPVSGIDYVFTLSNTTEAKPEFQLDDEIEISCRADFTFDSEKGKFKYLDPDGDYWIAKNSDGSMMCAEFARKVEPMVKVYFEASHGFSLEESLIPKELADKIIAGDFNV